VDLSDRDRRESIIGRNRGDVIVVRQCSMEDAVERHRRHTEAAIGRTNAAFRAHLAAVRGGAVQGHPIAPATIAWPGPAREPAGAGHAA
jgi:hypothetical protein